MSAEFAKQHGLESFWSLRMNDIHDVREPRFRPQWKREDPRRIVGDPRTVEGLYERQDLWTLVDYEHPDVAPRVLAVIEEVLRNYPIDGLELDFMRAPFYFRSHYLGQQVTDRQVEVLTELVAAVRALVLRESTRQRRPILMAARVPATVALGRRIGIDVQAWLQARLLDVLALSGGYVAFDHPVRELIELGHASDVPVYPCLSQSGLSDRPPRSLREEHQPTSFWKGAALRLWDEGADGMYTFNLFPDGSEQRRSYAIDVLSSIGSAEKLLDEERVFCISDAQTTLAPMVWSKDAEAYARALPDLAGDGQWATTPLATVGPLTIEGRPARLELRLDFGGLADGEDPPAITWNGRQLAAPLRTEDVAQVKRYCFALDPASSRTGDNELAVQTTRRNVQLLAAQLWILRPAEKG
jgi:hypothetical protein